MLFRLYGPQKAFFDKTGKLPDIELLERQGYPHDDRAAGDHHDPCAAVRKRDAAPAHQGRRIAAASNNSFQ